jgi:hypothetical protein
MEIFTFDSMEKLSKKLADDPFSLDDMQFGEIVDKFSLSTITIALELNPDARRGLSTTNVEKLTYSTLAQLTRKAVGPIDFSLAKDSRFWFSLVFGPLGVLAKPMEINRDKRLAWISRHWFASTHRDFLRNQSIAQYWWSYELLSRQRVLAIEDALDLFSQQQDLRTQIMDRTAINGNKSVIGHVLGIVQGELNDSGTYSRERVRDLLKYLNFDLGRRELEILPAAILEDTIRKHWRLTESRKE